jgi:hypothetical protein
MLLNSSVNTKELGSSVPVSSSILSGIFFFLKIYQIQLSERTRE